MALFVYVWLCIFLLPSNLYCLTLFNSVWLYMARFESVWLCLCLFDSEHVCLTLFNFVWLCLVLVDSNCLLFESDFILFDYGWLGIDWLCLKFEADCLWLTSNLIDSVDPVRLLFYSQNLSMIDYEWKCLKIKMFDNFENIYNFPQLSRLCTNLMLVHNIW